VLFGGLFSFLVPGLAEDLIGLLPGIGNYSGRLSLRFF
jgi:hypothetical protein